jgi:hypothetical protein
LGGDLAGGVQQFGQVVDRPCGGAAGSSHDRRTVNGPGGEQGLRYPVRRRCDTRDRVAGRLGALDLVRLH